MIAGFTATVVLSILMLMKTAMGVMPELNVIQMLSGMLGAPESPAVGWVAHFLIGTVLWGGLFAWLEPKLPGRPWVSGIVFGLIGWLLMMVLMMPMAGAGFFGMALGIMAPIMTMVLHVIFGAVMGGVYGALISRTAEDRSHGHHGRETPGQRR